MVRKLEGEEGGASDGQLIAFKYQLSEVSGGG